MNKTNPKINKLEDDPPSIKTKLLTTKETATATGLSYRTIQNARITGTGAAANLPFVRFSRNCIRYRSEDIQKFIEDGLQKRIFKESTYE